MTTGPLPEFSVLDTVRTASWSLIPFRIPAGWQVQYNCFDARRLPSGVVELSDSEDLLQLTKSPPPNGKGYEKDPHSSWREMLVDLGWYQDFFMLQLLDPMKRFAADGDPSSSCSVSPEDWDNSTQWRSTSIDEVVRMLEFWLQSLTTGALPRNWRDGPRAGRGGA